MDEQFRLVEIFSGDTTTAMILQEMLKEHNIHSVRQPREPLAAILGDRALPPYSAVLISERDATEHASAVEECLTLISDMESSSDRKDDFFDTNNGN